MYSQLAQTHARVRKHGLMNETIKAIKFTSTFSQFGSDLQHCNLSIIVHRCTGKSAF